MQRVKTTAIRIKDMDNKSEKGSEVMDEFAQKLLE